MNAMNKMGQIKDLTFWSNGNFDYHLPDGGARHGMEFYLTPTGKLKHALLSMSVTGDRITNDARAHPKGIVTHNLSHFSLMPGVTEVPPGKYFLVAITVAHGATSGQDKSDPLVKPVTLSQTLVSKLEGVWLKNRVVKLEDNIAKLDLTIRNLPTDAKLATAIEKQALADRALAKTDLDALKALINEKRATVVIERPSWFRSLTAIVVKSWRHAVQAMKARKKSALAKKRAATLKKNLEASKKPALSAHRAQKHAEYRLRWALAIIVFLAVCFSVLAYCLNHKSGHQGITPLASALLSTNAVASSNAPTVSVATIVATNSAGTNGGMETATASATNGAVAQQMVGRDLRIKGDHNHVEGPVNLTFNLFSTPPTIIKTTVIVTNQVAAKKPFTPARGYLPPTTVQKPFVPAQAVAPPQASVIIINNNQNVSRGGYGPGTVWMSGADYVNQQMGRRQVAFCDNYRAIRPFQPPRRFTYCVNN